MIKREQTFCADDDRAILYPPGQFVEDPVKMSVSDLVAGGETGETCDDDS